MESSSQSTERWGPGSVDGITLHTPRVSKIQWANCSAEDYMLTSKQVMLARGYMTLRWWLHYNKVCSAIVTRTSDRRLWECWDLPQIMVNSLFCCSIQAYWLTGDLRKQIFDANMISALRKTLHDHDNQVKQEALKMLELTTDYGECSWVLSTLQHW